MNSILTGKVFLIGALSTLASGCISDPKFVEEDFGNSVRQMVQSQIYDPAAASTPSELPPESQDGVTSSTSVEDYQEHSKRPKKDQEERSVINIGL